MKIFKEVIMKNFRKLLKPALSVLMNTAFLFLLVNVNTTCCGPAYQPKLPERIIKK